MTPWIRPILAAGLALATASTLVERARPDVQPAPRSMRSGNSHRPVTSRPISTSLLSNRPTPGLIASCEERATELRRQSGGRLTLWVHEPWILAGENAVADLQATYADTIAPAWQAMAGEYFHSDPKRSITVLLFATEGAYRYWAEYLFYDRQVSRYGYYKPGQAVIVVNLAEGRGALLHEMTHALLASDLPHAPAWFEEGLASLHEAADLETSDQGPRLLGRPNWRLEVLQRVLRGGQLPSLQTLFHRRRLRGSDEAIGYAEARYFCLFLQQHGLLSDYYRRLRERGSTDPWGEQSLQKILPIADWAELDARFIGWLRRQVPAMATHGLAGNQ